MPSVSGRAQRQLVVVGAGAAGLYTALCAAREGADVTLISATELSQTSSYWAQGGLAAALAPEDSAELHLEDTLRAGRGAVRASAARVLVDEAPAAVADLTALGVVFDGDADGGLAMSLEGGHSLRRIIHAGGAATGQRIVRRLLDVALADARITVIEGRRVSSLVTSDGRCTGVVLDDGERLQARATVLSTGGAAALWARMTNPSGAVGSGLLLAYEAGAALADIEFMQFHPTAVVSGGSGDGLLVTEAIRGEGARLLNQDGERFVDELAPRDEVARAIYAEIVSRPGSEAVGLDMRHVDPALFPNVIAALGRVGIDAQRNVIPVAPAAHYMMGGIETDLHGALDPPRPVRRRRVLLHGLARSQPTRIQLAQRVLRVRRTRGAFSARRAGGTGRGRGHLGVGRAGKAISLQQLRAGRPETRLGRSDTHFTSASVALCGPCA